MKRLLWMIVASVGCLCLAGCLGMPGFLMGGVTGAPSDGGISATQIPRHACPTPTPMLYGPDGPPKRTWTTCTPDPITGEPMCEEHREDWPIWGQEYGHLGNPPPAPTPYTKTGSDFYLDELINLYADLDVHVDVETISDRITETASLSATMSLYRVTTTWHNRGDALIVHPSRQIHITAIRESDGRQQGGAWGTSVEAVEQMGEVVEDTAILSTTISPSPDPTTLVIPIIAPRGQVQTVALALDVPGAPGGLQVRFNAGDDPHCDHAGTVAAQYAGTPVPVIPPAPGATGNGAVAFALEQLGRPYCWGGKGWDDCSGCDPINGCVTRSCAVQGGDPCWDCSGLTWGAWFYGEEVNVSHGTRNQQHYPSVPQSAVAPGDFLLFSSFNAQGRSEHITHVGLYTGDIDGDGCGDMVHAASDPLGVIVTPCIFQNTAYTSRLVDITRPPRQDGSAGGT